MRNGKPNGHKTEYEIEVEVELWNANYGPLARNSPGVQTPNTLLTLLSFE